MSSQGPNRCRYSIAVSTAGDSGRAERSWRPESLPIFNRTHEAGHHPARIVCLIDDDEPVEIQRIRIAAEISEVLHHHVCFVEILRRNFRTFNYLPQYLRTGQRGVVQSID